MPARAGRKPTSSPASPAKASSPRWRRRKEYIRAGDIFQVRAVAAPERAVPGAPGRRVPRAALAESVAVHVLPRLRRHPGRRRLAGDPGAPAATARVTVRPIAGTRPRGATPEEDAALEAELLADPKERAEHLMLIDLARNDVGRIAETGRCKVDRAVRDRALLHVHAHRQRTSKGTLKDGMSYARRAARDVPGRHRQRRAEGPRDGMIDELEPIKRGIYGGACGYLGWHGDMRHRDRDPHRRDQGRHACTCRPAPASSPTRCPRWNGRRRSTRRARVLRAAEQVQDGLDGESDMLLMIDNYDCFTYNLVQYLGELGAEVQVVRNDEIDARRDRRAGARAHRDLARARARRTRRASRST